MAKPFRKLSKGRRRRGVSSVIGTIFFILVVFIVMAIIVTMFNSFYSFTKQDMGIQQMNQQRSETSLSDASFQFGTPALANSGKYFPENSISTSTSASVDTNGPGGGTEYTFERKLFYVSSTGLYWAFYSNGASIVYRTSPDGISWSAATTLTSSVTSISNTAEGYDFSAWVSGSSLYYIATGYDLGDDDFRFNSGTLNAPAAGSIAGTITLNTEVSVATADPVYSFGTIVVSSATTPVAWVSIEEKASATSDALIYLMDCSLTTATQCNTATNWATSTHYTMANDHDYPNELVPLSASGELVLIYDDSQGIFTTADKFETGALDIQTYSGTAWTTTAVTIPTTPDYDLSRASAVAIGSIVYFAGYADTATGDTTGEIYFWALTYPNTVTTPVALVTSAANWDVGVSQNGTSTSVADITIAYGSGSNVYWEFNPSVSTSTPGTGWSTAQTISTSETDVSGLQSTVSGTWGVIWSSGSASPFMLKFAFLANSLSLDQMNVPTVITTSTEDATSYSSENKLFFSEGLWWDFFSDGTNLAYSTSPDGVVWSAETNVGTGGPPAGATAHGYTITAFQSGNSIYLAASYLNGYFGWRQGVFEASGTIAFSSSWNAASLSSGETATGPISIEVDYSENVWVALGVSPSSGNYGIQVYELPSGTGSVTFTNILTSATSTSLVGCIILPPSTGIGAVLVWGTNSVTGAVSIQTSSGSTFGTAVSPANDYVLGSSDAEIVNNMVYFAGLASTSTGASVGTLDYWDFSVGASATSTPILINSATEPWQAGLIPGPTAGSLVLFDAYYSTLAYYTSSNYGATWGSNATLTTLSPIITGLATSSQGTFAVSWTSGNIANYNVQFAAIPSISLASSSSFPVNAISLYVYNSATGVLAAHFDTIASASGVLGSFNYWINEGTTVTIPLSIFSWTTSTSYVITVDTSNGVLVSNSVTSAS